MRYGVNGDPLRDGKLDLPEVLDVPTPEECAWAREFVAKRRWREAVTYRETAPHEYVVRTWEADERRTHDFDRFITSIRRSGRADLYYRVRHPYWAIDEFKYWTMGWPVGDAHAFLSLGTRDPFAGWATPLWLRFLRETEGFPLIRPRIDAAGMAWVESGGDVWIPLEVPVGVTGERMVDALHRQAEDVVRTAFPSS